MRPFVYNLKHALGRCGMNLL